MNADWTVEGGAAIQRVALRGPALSQCVHALPASMRFAYKRAEVNMALHRRMRVLGVVTIADWAARFQRPAASGDVATKVAPRRKARGYYRNCSSA